MTTATAETITVSRAQLIEVFATLEAVGGFVCENLDGSDVPLEFRSDVIYQRADLLRTELLGSLSEREYAEKYARSSEIEAELIEHGLERVVSSAEVHAQLVSRDGRPAQLREFVKRIREVDPADVDEVRFPSRRELWEARTADAS